MRFLQDERGIAYTWIVILASIFAVMVCYSILYDTLMYYYSYGMERYGNDPQYASTMNNVLFMVNYFVVPFLVSLIIYGIVSAIRRERDTYREWP